LYSGEFFPTDKDQDRKKSMARKERWLKKAEDWLAKPLNAADCWSNKKTVGCWSNGEAIVYFLSRENRSIDKYQSQAPAIRKHWRLARAYLEKLVADGGFVWIDPMTDEEPPASPRFWGIVSYAHAKITLDATMMRVDEWLGIGGFDETWKQLASHVCWEASRIKASDESPAYLLFSLCRSSVALNNRPEMVNAFLWALLRGKPNPARPWEIVQHRPKRAYEDECEGEIVKSAAIAASVAFAAVRGVTDDITMGQQAQKFLIKQQSESGAWPRIGIDLKDIDSVLNTAMVVHALSLAKPRVRGINKALERAHTWLYKEQASDGCWVEYGVDSVYLTVLVLDAIELAAGGDTVTMTFTESPPAVTKQPRKKAGRKLTVPISAPAEIRKAYRQAKTKSLIGEMYDTFAKRYQVGTSVISKIARKKKPYDK